MVKHGLFYKIKWCWITFIRFFFYNNSIIVIDVKAWIPDLSDVEMDSLCSRVIAAVKRFEKKVNK